MAGFLITVAEHFSISIERRFIIVKYCIVDAVKIITSPPNCTVQEIIQAACIQQVYTSLLPSPQSQIQSLNAIFCHLNPSPNTIT
jgi:hypothetical protein